MSHELFLFLSYIMVLWVSLCELIVVDGLLVCFRFILHCLTLYTWILFKYNLIGMANELFLDIKNNLLTTTRLKKV